MILSIFTLFFRVMECMVLGAIAAWLAMHVAQKVLDQAEAKIIEWVGDAERALHVVYQSSSSCVGFLIIGGFAFDCRTICFRLLGAVVAIWLARRYLRTL